MNLINCTHIEYLKKTRTIETIEVKSKAGRKIIYIYNHEGIHYSCFESIQELVHFFNGKFEAPLSFDDEMELDSYLKEIDLNSSQKKEITKQTITPKNRKKTPCL